ncbi:DUF2252 family protein [Nocardioidaceae bacterium]|nr:DUF2252 family protein [Nocardioidaceae bacterium]
MASDDLSGKTRADLLELARDRGVSGRSSMSKKELQHALARAMREPGEPGEAPAADRLQAFRDLAARRARGEMVFLPSNLTGHERRMHVRQTLREDHQKRISTRAEDTAAKFTKLHDNLFSFFRGTCLLFYRDMAGEDAWMPTVLTLGDVHPENFGVMPSADNVPIFGVNDFDEAFYAPFTWDLKRGAAGFVIGAEVEGELGRKHQRRIAAAFVSGYVEAMQEYADDAIEQQGQLRQDNAPKVIRKLIESAVEEPQADWLARKYHDEHRRGFRADDEHVPVSGRREEFQEALDRFVEENDIEVPERTRGMKVKDVCQRLGQGTASLGLPRYYLMIEGPNGDGTDDVILEFKQARRSALAGLAPPSEFVMDGSAQRISHAQGVHLVRGDRFYGAVEMDGLSFMVRERAPFRDDIDLDELSKKTWRKYAAICGRSLAQSHALSDEAGLLDHDIEPDILAAMGPRDLFVHDIVEWAMESADRHREDHRHFRRDHELGAFAAVDRVFK